MLQATTKPLLTAFCQERLSLTLSQPAAVCGDDARHGRGLTP
jgi:hypothetical protein